MGFDGLVLERAWARRLSAVVLSGVLAGMGAVVFLLMAGLAISQFLAPVED